MVATASSSSTAAIGSPSVVTAIGGATISSGVVTKDVVDPIGWDAGIGGGGIVGTALVVVGV